MHGELLAEGVGGLALPVQESSERIPLADRVEGGVKARQVLGGGPDRRRIAVYQLVRLVGLTELLLSDTRAQVGGDVVAEVLDLVGPRRTDACSDPGW